MISQTPSPITHTNWTLTCRHAYMHTCRHADMHTCTHADMQTCTHADMQTCRHADMQTCRHADMRHTLADWQTECILTCMQAPQTAHSTRLRSGHLSSRRQIDSKRESERERDGEKRERDGEEVCVCQCVYVRVRLEGHILEKDTGIARGAVRMRE
jgi:hypothetical protein